MKLEDGREVTPVNEFQFQNYDGPPTCTQKPETAPSSVYLTCKNHPTALYLSKNPYQRSLHFLKTAEGFPYGVECECPFSELVVLAEGQEK